jgi:hypothetical protein
MDTFYVEEIYDDREIYFDMLMHLIFELGRIWNDADLINLIKKERVHRTLEEFFQEMNIAVPRHQTGQAARRTFNYELREYVKKAIRSFHSVSITAKCSLLTRLGVALNYQIYYRRNAQ